MQHITIDPKEAAKTATNVLVQLAPAKSRVFTNADLTQLSGVDHIEKSSGLTYEEVRAFELWFLAYVTELRRLVMPKLSRWLTNKYAEGYYLCEPGEVMPDSEAEFTESIRKLYSKTNFKKRNLDSGLLTIEQRQEAADIHARMGSIHALARPRAF